jgi:hypothetical protein
MLERARRRDPSPVGYELRQFSDLNPAEQAVYEQAPWLAWSHAPKEKIDEEPNEKLRLGKYILHQVEGHCWPLDLAGQSKTTNKRRIVDTEPKSEAEGDRQRASLSSPPQGKEQDRNHDGNESDIPLSESFKTRRAA